MVRFVATILRSVMPALLIFLIITTVALIMYPDVAEGICGRKSCIVPDGWSPPPTPTPQPPPLSSEEIERQRLEQESAEAYDKGVKCGKRGDYDCAINHYRETLRLNPDHKAARNNLGWILNEKANKFYGQGDKNKAIEYYKEALKYKPDDKVIRNNLRGAEEAAEAERRWKAEEAERESKRTEAKAKMDEMLDELEKEFAPPNAKDFSQTGTLSFSEAPSSGALEFVSPEAPSSSALEFDKPYALKREPKAEGPPKKGLKIKEVPSPYGYTSKQEREAQLKMLTKLSDERLDKRIERTTRALEFMKKDFLSVEKSLNEWVREAQDAEEKALIISLKALANLALKLPRGGKIDDRKLGIMKKLADNGLKILDYGEPAMKLKRDPLDREANLEMARNVANELHGILREHGEAYFSGKVASELGTELTGFGGFIVDYTYEAARWAAAGAQIRSIIDNLDRPKGKLDAQLSLKRTLEDLTKEKNRRKGRGR